MLLIIVCLLIIIHFCVVDYGMSPRYHNFVLLLIMLYLLATIHFCVAYVLSPCYHTFFMFLWYVSSLLYILCWFYGMYSRYHKILVL